MTRETPNPSRRGELNAELQRIADAYDAQQAIDSLRRAIIDRPRRIMQRLPFSEEIVDTANLNENRGEK